MAEAASRGRFRARLARTLPDSDVPYWILVAAIFVAAVVIAQRASFGGAAIWFAQYVDLVAAPMTVIAIGLAIAFPRIGEMGLIGVTWVASKRHAFALVAVSTLPFMVIGAILVVGTIPISADELVPIWQARVFASFHLTAQYDPLLIDHFIPPVSQGLFILVTPEGEAISVYWPGQAMLLTPLVALGVPWLIGPIFGASALYFIGRLTSTLIDRKAGIVAMVLTIASGQFLLVAMTSYPEGVHLALSAAFVWLLILGRSRHLFLAGFVGGLALALKNPFPHVLFAIPWIIWLLVSPERRRGIIPLALGYAPWLLLMAGWMVLQNAFASPSPQADEGFWLSKLGELIQPPSGEIVVVRLTELLSAWSWSAPGLLLLAAIGLVRTTDVRLRLLAASFAASVVGYMFFPGTQGLGYGARYFHPAWVALPILAAGAISTLRNPSVARFTFAACVFALLLVLPLQMSLARGLQDRQAEPRRALAGPGVDLYFVHFRGIKGVSETVLANDLAGAGELVLVSQGEARDQEVVDMLFPGSRLVTENEWGRGYARPSP